MNILFVCKYNRFRSKVAEAYLESLKINGISVRSRGIIQGDMNRNKNELKIPREFGLNIQDKPNGISFADLKWADYVIVTADNVPKELFKSKRVKNKITQWQIPDIYPNSSQEDIRKVIKQIIKNIDKLVKELK